jgi:hypothetical protein
MSSPDKSSQHKAKSIKDVFARAVATTGKIPRTKQTGKRRFSDKEVQGVLKLLEGLQLPIPQKEAEFMAGTEGCIIFINRYGAVIRIEEKDELYDVNDSQWVLQPLARFKVGKAVVEICPACAFESDIKRYNVMKEGLQKDGLKLHDPGLRQTGRIPVRTPEFPNGMTVVVDRQAVKKLSDDIKPVKNNLQAMMYAPLRKKMAEAHDGKTFDAGKVREFWALCADFVRDGKLVAGWNDYQPLYDNKWEGKNPKGLQAAEKAKAYESLFKK